jgi:acyl-CoA thioesterase FadM
MLLQRILRGEELLLEAEVLVVAVSSGKPARLPAGLKDRLGQS